MTFRPNRRFLRDCEQLINQGHYLEFDRTPRGGYKFYINDQEFTPEDLMKEAKAWRIPLTKEQIDQAHREAEELYQALNWDD